jgi:GNAT superfamily N-acetyltransferase
MGMCKIFKVRTDDDISATASLARLIWTEHYTPIIGLGQVEYMLEHFQSEKAVKSQVESGYLYYLAEKNGEYVGYFALVPEPEKGEIQLSKYYVHSLKRGQGVGRKIFNYILNLAKKRGYKSIWLTVNKNNLNSLTVYLRLGFENRGSIVQDIGAGYVMDDYLLKYILE